MTDTDRSSNGMAEGAHAARRARRLALVCIGAFAIAMIAVALLMQRDDDLSDALRLRGGGALEFQGVSRGARLSHIPPYYSRDLEGYAWHHAYAPPLTWREHLHRLSPPFVRSYLPASWRPRSAMSLIVPRERLLRFGVHGTMDDSSLHFTWEDSNGFESLGIDDSLNSNRTYGIILSGSLPPARSPEVILRVRERQESKPLAEWPLLGEMRMKNPVLAPPSTTPVDTLPATRTVKDVALTLQSIIVDTAAAGVDLTRLQLAMPHQNPRDWNADVAFYDERGSGVQIQRKITSRHSKGISLKTSGALWSDGPWHVRIVLRANGSKPARLGAQAKFTAVPLPGHAPAGGFTKTESVGRFPVTLTDLTLDTSGHDERLAAHFIHPLLPGEHRFRILSAIDDLGRQYTWGGGSRNANGPTTTRCQFYLDVPKAAEPKAKSLDVTVEIEEPLVYDFFVMPEFKGLGQGGARP